METKVVQEEGIAAAVECLKKGEPVVFPTETVYGLGAPIFDLKAVGRIFEIKARPLDNPLIAHVSSMEQARLLSDDLPPLFELLANRFWPGPLALIVKRRKEVPDQVSAGHPTIAIRMPSHPIARKLIEAVAVPLVAPSANLSGKPSPTRVRDVLEDLNGKVSLIIDGGECEVGIESTVLSLYHSVPTILRPGKITQEMLEEAIGMNIALATSSEPVISPGMKYRHYAPKAKIRIVTDSADLQGPFILSPVLIPGKQVRPLSAKLFYSQLREADRLGVSQIEIFCPPSIRQDAGLMNRLLRAASH